MNENYIDPLKNKQKNPRMTHQTKTKWKKLIMSHDKMAKTLKKIKMKTKNITVKAIIISQLK